MKGPEDLNISLMSHKDLKRSESKLFPHTLNTSSANILIHVTNSADKTASLLHSENKSNITQYPLLVPAYRLISLFTLSYLDDNASQEECPLFLILPPMLDLNVTYPLSWCV